MPLLTIHHIHTLARDYLAVSESPTHQTTTLSLSQWTVDRWAPLTVADFQLEAIMLDPHIRSTFKAGAPTAETTPYATTVQLPDVYGVFKLQLTYYRHGYSFIDQHDLINIRPLRHNEYNRFLSVAWPYYASMGSMMAGFWVFAAVWLFNRDAEASKPAKLKSQ